MVIYKHTFSIESEKANGILHPVATLQKWLKIPKMPQFRAVISGVFGDFRRFHPFSVIETTP
jgi:hypothetical protein